MGELQRLLLQSTILGGEVLSQPRPISTAEQRARNLPIPLTLQLIDAARLDSQYSDASDRIYRGIELDKDNRRVAYHLRDAVPGDVWAGTGEIRRIPADRLVHLFLEEDIDQLRGVSWFASCLLQMRDTGDYQYNELKASAMAACIVLGYKGSSGRKKFGLAPGDQEEEQDTDGNPINRIQPGMFINLGDDGALEGFNPARPGANAEAFIKHMLRGTAAGFAGVKSSTLTGDYRGSSFSSERSADNDAWPELEAAQEWFACHQLQPVWEAILTSAVVNGYFDGVLTAAEFQRNPMQFLGAEWQGPISRSINPKDDAEAAGMRVQKLLSSPQIEAAAQGRNWQDLLRDIAEFSEFAETLGLPEEVINNVLGVKPQPAAPETTAPNGAEPPLLPDEEADDEEDTTPAATEEEEPAYATSEA